MDVPWPQVFPDRRTLESATTQQGGLGCLDVSGPPHGGRISRRANGRTLESATTRVCMSTHTSTTPSFTLGSRSTWGRERPRGSGRRVWVRERPRRRVDEGTSNKGQGRGGASEPYLCEEVVVGEVV